MQEDFGTISYGTARARGVLLATVLASGMAFLDSTVVNVALPAIEEDLEAGFSGLQWTVDGYLLTLGSLILIGGSLGDLYGRRRIFILGLVAFTAASLLCGIAPTTELLVVARVLQGIGAAFLVPGSLALISASFRGHDRPQAIGAWSGLSGVSTAIGPFVGGWLVDSVSWRLVFLLNLPLAIVAVVATLRYVPESRDPQPERHPDIWGAALTATALACILFALIEGPVRGWSDPSIVGTAAAGAAAVVVFGMMELRRRDPMVPLDIFHSRQFTAANATTLAVYAALSGAMFFLMLQLQRVLGYSALEAGSSLIPMTLLLLALSPAAGRLSHRLGPRLPMTAGPIVAGLGLALLASLTSGDAYFQGIFPGVIVFGLGLALTVAPLTATVLGAVETRHAGIGSAINNAVARLAGLLAIAVLPIVAGMTNEPQVSGNNFTDGFQRAMWLSAALCVVGGLISAAFITRPRAVTTGLPPSIDQPCEAC